MRKLQTVTLTVAALVGLAAFALCAIPAGADPQFESESGPGTRSPGAFAQDLRSSRIAEQYAGALAPLRPLPAPPTAPNETEIATAARHDRLTTYVLSVMNGWTHAVSQMPVADYEAVASDIAQAVILEPEGPLTCDTFAAPDGKRCLWGPGWNTDHAKAVLLAALGYWEGARYAAYVDEYRCNDLAWRADQANARILHLGGNCDNGHAHSLWQIHPIIDRQAPLYALCNRDAVDGSRLGAARCALSIAASSIRSSGTLTSYTGEFWGEHPKADIRLDFAQRAIAKRPWR